jgi:RNA polymerase sigma-70 factor (ECF subfamily)
MIEAQVYTPSAVFTGARQGTSAATTDETLVERIAAGDRHAMQMLFTRHHVRVFRFVLKMVQDRALADDLVSEIFLDLWRQAHQFDARAKASTWLLAIARYKAISAVRRRRVDADLDDAGEIADPSNSPEAISQMNGRNQILRHCIAKLSPSHREIIDLVYYHEKPIDAVADIIGIPLNTVKTRMFYARRQLATLLTEAGIDRNAL